MTFLVSIDTLLVDSLWKVAHKWRAGFDVEEVDSARVRIISLGEDALTYIMNKYLTKNDRFDAGAVKDMCLKKPEICVKGIKSLLSKKDTFALRNALYVSSEVKIPDIGDDLIRILRKQRNGVWISRVLRAIYKSGNKNVCEYMGKYFKDGYEYVRMGAALIVGEKGCKSFKGYLWKLLSDSVFVVRDAARESIVKMGFSIVEFKKAVKETPPVELLKLLHLKCPSRRYIEILKDRTDPRIYQLWENYINCG